MNAVDRSVIEEFADKKMFNLQWVADRDKKPSKRIPDMSTGGSKVISSMVQARLIFSQQSQASRKIVYIRYVSASTATGSS